MTWSSLRRPSRLKWNWVRLPYFLSQWTVHQAQSGPVMGRPQCSGGLSQCETKCCLSGGYSPSPAERILSVKKPQLSLVAVVGKGQRRTKGETCHTVPSWSFLARGAQVPQAQKSLLWTSSLSTLCQEEWVKIVNTHPGWRPLKIRSEFFQVENMTCLLLSGILIAVWWFL